MNNKIEFVSHEQIDSILNLQELRDAIKTQSYNVNESAIREAYGQPGEIASRNYVLEIELDCSEESIYFQAFTDLVTSYGAQIIEVGYAGEGAIMFRIESQ